MKTRLSEIFDTLILSLGLTLSLLYPSPLLEECVVSLIVYPLVRVSDVNPCLPLLGDAGEAPVLALNGLTCG